MSAAKRNLSHLPVQSSISNWWLLRCDLQTHTLPRKHCPRSLITHFRAPKHFIKNVLIDGRKIAILADMSLRISLNFITCCVSFNKQIDVYEQLSPLGGKLIRRIIHETRALQAHAYIVPIKLISPQMAICHRKRKSIFFGVNRKSISTGVIYDDAVCNLSND